MACLSDFCLIFHSFVKKKRILVSILVCPQPHQSPRIFDNCSIIPSDLVFSLKLLHQLQNFLLYLSVVITYDRQEKTLFHNLSYPCTITLKKKTSWLRKIIRAFILLQYVVIFCFVYRGTSKSLEAVAFRRWFFKLSEIRSLVSRFAIIQLR